MLSVFIPKEIRPPFEQEKKSICRPIIFFDVPLGIRLHTAIFHTDLKWVGRVCFPTLVGGNTMESLRNPNVNPTEAMDSGDPREMNIFF
ncbi:hypothetical protein JTE90_018727 [Oedothorax gibbosus]|uniref:Uncharacterized protein n=1 Tax=Oedothorax gibbosus TaxID=931172 RepID=A0AAV6UM63_9ARAC|nr:hypothetical protein JTE90_018727 [Oedothorax gibbosus]